MSLRSLAFFVKGSPPPSFKFNLLNKKMCTVMEDKETDFHCSPPLTFKQLVLLLAILRVALLSKCA